MQAAMKLSVPFTGRFDRDQLDIVLRKATLEQTVSLRIVLNPQLDSGGQNVDVKPVLANVDSDVRLAALLFGRFLALHAGLAPHHLFRTRAENGRIKLPRGAAHQGNSAIPPIRIGTG